MAAKEFSNELMGENALAIQLLLRLREEREKAEAEMAAMRDTLHRLESAVAEFRAIAREMRAAMNGEGEKPERVQ